MAAQPTRQSTEPDFVAFDLGTGTSRIAYARGEGHAFVTDLAGDARIPSVIALSGGGGILAGAAARDRQALYPQHTLRSLRSLLTAGPGTVTPRGPFFPHPVNSDVQTMLQVDVGERERPAIELIALFLAFLRRSAELALERPVTAGVVTVPTCFTPFDRQTLRVAARMAGLERVRLIDEPIAVAEAWLAAGHSGRAAVCTWGAGYLSAALVELQDGFLRVLSTAGSAEVGGDQIDLQLAGDFLGKVKEKRGQLENESHIARYVLVAAEKAKHGICERGHAELQLPIVGGKEAVRQTYTNEDLDRWCESLRTEASRVCEQLLTDAGLLKGDLDALVLAGGLTRIPALREHLETCFGLSAGDVPDPEEAAVLGALARARLLDHAQSEPLVLDVLPCSLGLEAQAGSMSPILKRGAVIPGGKREVFTTYLERQTDVAIQLFAKAASDWAPLARIELSQIPPMKAGLPAIEVSFAVDEDGVLEVTALETTKQKPLGLELRPIRGLSSSAVRATLESVPKVKAAEFEEALREELRARGRFVLESLRELSRRRAGIITRDEKQLIAKKAKELEEVLEGADLMEIRTCAQELEEAARPLMQRDLDASLQLLLH